MNCEESSANFGARNNQVDYFLVATFTIQDWSFTNVGKPHPNLKREASQDFHVIQKSGKSDSSWNKYNSIFCAKNVSSLFLTKK